MPESATDKLLRGWCPTVERPMETGDGLLIRLRPPHARLTAVQASRIAAAARACGNGLIDLTGRGNLQIRGVRPSTDAGLAEILSAAAPGGAASQGQCIISPLAGVDPLELIDARRLADEVDAAIRTIEGAAAVPAKFSVVVDGGGLPLDDVEADVRLVAIDAARMAVALAGPGDHVWIGACPLSEAPAVTASIASAFAGLRRGGNPARRIRGLALEERRRLAATTPLAAAPPPQPRTLGVAVGLIAVAGTTAAVGIGIPFGRFDADLLDSLAEWSLQMGRGELRLSPWRSIIFPRVAKPDALIAVAAKAGLIVDAGDPRRALVACPGAPSCGRASVSTHADATRLAEQAGHLLEGTTVHFSGCAKGCARRAAADLTLVGEDGAYAVVVRGNTGDRPRTRMAIGTILARLKTLDGDGPLAALSTERLTHAFEEPA